MTAPAVVGVCMHPGGNWGYTGAGCERMPAAGRGIPPHVALTPVSSWVWELLELGCDANELFLRAHAGL